MAKAIAKNLNHTENCVEYHKSVLSMRQGEIQNMLEKQEESNRYLQSNVQIIFDSISKGAERADKTVREVSQINDEVDALKAVASQLGEMVDTLNAQISRYVSLSSEIVSISTQTKLLSMNASVEAAHARELGKGFAVVAGEMKVLSDKSAASAKEIIASNEMVLPMLDEVRAFSGTLGERTQNISNSTHGILEAVKEIERNEHDVMGAASRLIGNSGTGNQG